MKAKTNLAMNPDKPKKVTDVSTQLEQWTALVESLETYGPSYSLGLPFRVTALQVIMHHASEWFDSWQSECYKTPDALTIDSYQKLYQKCEDWARKKRLDADAHHVNMDISGVDGSNGSQEDDGYYDEEGNWWDYDGNCWPVNVEGDTNEVSKGKGKGWGPQCYNCYGYGHLGRDCPNKLNTKGKGGGKGGKSGGKNGGKKRLQRLLQRFGA